MVDQTHEEYYQSEVLPLFEAVETLLAQQDIPYFFLVMLDEENMEYRNSFPPAGVKRLIVTIQKDMPAKIVPIPDVDFLGTVIEGRTDVSQFDGKGIDIDVGN